MSDNTIFVDDLYEAPQCLTSTAKWTIMYGSVKDITPIRNWSLTAKYNLAKHLRLL